VLIADLELP
jgi:hypothetical protein